MFCNLSETVPQEPVVSKKSGHLYEKRLLLKYLAENDNRCPMTGETLMSEDIIDVKSKKGGVNPRPVTATSIPGLLHMLANEWDSLMLETFTMKQQFNTAKQELSHSLYQHDAACRVISRLMKERDEAKAALVNLNPSNGSNAMDDEESDENLQLTKDVVGKMIATSEELSQQRKQRTLPADLKSPEAMTSISHKSTYPIHTAPIRSIASSPAVSSLVLTGSDDGTANLFSKDKVIATLRTGTKPVNSVLFHSSYDLAFTGSDDSTIKFWSLSNPSNAIRTLNIHTGEVTGLSLQPSGDYLVSCSSDKSWAFSDINTGVVLTRKRGDNKYTSLQFHPDGLIFAAGVSENGSIKIFDVKSQDLVTSFDKHKASVTDLSFSENGYNMCSASADGTVKVWDLRKTSDICTLELGSAVKSVKFDHSGVYLAAGTDQGNIHIYQSKIWKELARLDRVHDGSVNGLVFGKNASYLASAGSDSLLKFFA